MAKCKKSWRDYVLCRVGRDMHEGVVMSEEVDGMAQMIVGKKLWQAQPTPENIKVEIAARLLAGEKPVELMKEFNVSLPTISRIKQKYINPEMLAKMDDVRLAVLGDLMTLNLEMGLEAAVRLAMMTQDEGWLATQNAGDIGKMYGIIIDKTVKMAEVMEGLADAQAMKVQDHTSYES